MQAELQEVKLALEDGTRDTFLHATEAAWKNRKTALQFEKPRRRYLAGTRPPRSRPERISALLDALAEVS